MYFLTKFRRTVKFIFLFSIFLIQFLKLHEMLMCSRCRIALKQYSVGGYFFRREFAQNKNVRSKNLAGNRQTKFPNYTEPPPNGFEQNYDSLMNFYQRTARNSVLIRCGNRFDIEKFLSSIFPESTTQFDVRHYSMANNNYYLCEIGRKNVEYLIHSHPQASDEGLPVRLRVLLLRNGPPHIGQMFKQSSVENIDILSLKNSLRTAANLNDQMRLLVDNTALTSTGVRLRFFCASLIEDVFSGIFPFGVCKPFGSTVNGFGQRGGDLDMAVEFEDPKVRSTLQKNLRSKLRLPTTLFGDLSVRDLSRRTLRIYGAVLATMIPFCREVTPIIKARVPIVKFNWSLGSLACDLTINNVTGHEMAKILWVYSQLDERVTPLIFTVRYWAKCVGITHSVPGPYITNFQLMCLVIFFLQTHTDVLLPSIETLRGCAAPNDEYGIVSRPIDVPLLARKKRPKTSADLLVEFFELYSTFNFAQNGISIVTGETMKNGYSELFIKNPVEMDLNVAKNVEQRELDEFVSAAQTALSTLLSSNDKYHRRDQNLWGLLKLCESKSRTDVILPSEFDDDHSIGNMGEQTLATSPYGAESKMEDFDDNDLNVGEDAKANVCENSSKGARNDVSLKNDAVSIKDLLDDRFNENDFKKSDEEADDGVKSTRTSSMGTDSSRSLLTDASGKLE